MAKVTLVIQAVSLLRKHWRKILVAIVAIFGLLALIPTVIIMGLFGLIPIPSDDVQAHYQQVASQTGVKKEYLIYFDTVRYHNEPRTLNQIEATSKKFYREEKRTYRDEDGKTETEIVIVYLSMEEVMSNEGFTQEEREHMEMLLKLGQDGGGTPTDPDTPSEEGTGEILLPVKNSPFIWPTPQINNWTDTFRKRINPQTGKKEFHKGVDLASGNDKGKKIVAARAGKVIHADYDDKCGNGIIIQHDKGYQTKYCHASKLYVKKGQEVPQGYVIAAVGSTGNSTGPHLHFGIIEKGKYVNPLPFIIDTKP